MNGIPPHRVSDVIRERVDEHQRCLNAQKNAIRTISATRERVAQRQAQLQRIMASVKVIAERKALRRERRREKIYRHISKNLREIEKRTEEKRAETWEMAKEVAELLNVEKHLEMMMQVEGRKAGVYDSEGPDELEMVLVDMLEGDEFLEHNCAEDDGGKGSA